eukprot:gb/GECG01011827.1/.p1 GENE.gb/GECG01011827.1/~~gb/GECG01011827.1/.p1  ORF type:complete len:1408 (+),score=168.33 gb/GECG01011827.1/:1-4224(+)
MPSTGATQASSSQNKDGTTENGQSQSSSVQISGNSSSSGYKHGTKFVPSYSNTGLPRDTHIRLAELALPHIQSFNYAVDEGLAEAIADLPAREFIISSKDGESSAEEEEEDQDMERPGKKLQIWIEDAVITSPVKTDSSDNDSRLWPSECRERKLTYAGNLIATIGRRVEGGQAEKIQVKLGVIPVMVRSNRCHLAGLSPAELVQQKEDATEFGGYFICNGIERVVRMLQIPKRNYPMAVTRSSYVKRGSLYSTKAVTMRCVRRDQTSVTITLHYLLNGNAMVRFSLRRQEFFIPAVLILKGLKDTTDREIFDRVLAGDSKNTYLADRMELLLTDTAESFSLGSREDVLRYLGQCFRSILDMPATITDVDAGKMLLDRFILVHLSENTAKFDVMVLMMRKLYAFVAGQIIEDNPDSFANQELLLTGHLYLMTLKEKLEEILKGIQDKLSRDVRLGKAYVPGNLTQQSRSGSVPNVFDLEYFRRSVEMQPDIGKKMYNFLATGNLQSSSGLDLMQNSGFTVVADKINFLRFLTHFRAVHRGQYFSTMKTTAVRKLLPECWGYLCPVHTPDGAPCGLLNHLAAPCQVVSYPVEAPALSRLLISLGVIPYPSLGTVMPHDHLPVMLDGKLVGGGSVKTLVRVARALRRLKAKAGATMIGEGNICVQDCYQHRYKQTREEEEAKQGSSGTLTKSSRERLNLNKFSFTAKAAMGTAILDDNRNPEDHYWVPPSLEVSLIPPADYQTPFDTARAMDSTKKRAESTSDPDSATRKSPAGNASTNSSSSDSDENPESSPSPYDFRYGRCTGAELTGTFPGLFLSTQPGRAIRPTRQLWSGQVELVSSNEQVHLDIACTPEDIVDVIGLSNEEREKASELIRRASEGDKKAGDAILGEDLKQPPLHPYTHIELSPMGMLSVAASLTPFSDLNQSPRNMYQCQMAKQTMGVPSHAYNYRTDNKLYKIQTPQAPLVQNIAQSSLGLDEYPAGTNAVVAVISYTGYDMEDAMIVNKSAYERGFAHASVYKNYTIDLVDGKSKSANEMVFSNEPTVEQRRRTGKNKAVETLDGDGLPPVGIRIGSGEPLYCVKDTVTGQTKIARHKESEPAFVEEVKVLGGGDTAFGGTGSSRGPLQKVSIRLRFDRNPVVGDKFSSRHGQKGILSMLWPQEDMPFSESGISPDVIINPHAFPSRMTIGMLVESMAGKAGAMHGRFQDSTPFRFGEQQRAVDFFGEQLEKAGYSYYGAEPMYSGISGTELHVHIYMGVVYYQRLRHMVSDKSQVRSTGPINNLTRQPVKGRKNQGGIRLGEMERDSLLAHGTAFLVQDRLMNCSDRHIAIVCRNCGQLISTLQKPRSEQFASSFGSNNENSVVEKDQKYFCLSCDTGNYCVETALPYVFRYLVNELAAMNIRLTLGMEAS